MKGERLAEVRKDHNDTQANLAKRLHVTVATVRGWEQNRCSPPHETLVEICRLYEVSSDYLLGLSQVDPAYDKKRRQMLFSEEERQALREFERYLLWKKKAKTGK